MTVFICFGSEGKDRFSSSRICTFSMNTPQVMRYFAYGNSKKSGWVCRKWKRASSIYRNSPPSSNWSLSIRFNQVWTRWTTSMPFQKVNSAFFSAAQCSTLDILPQVWFMTISERFSIQIYRRKRNERKWKKNNTKKIANEWNERMETDKEPNEWAGERTERASKTNMGLYKSCRITATTFESSQAN